MLPDIQGDRRHAVDSRDLAWVLDRVEHASDIAHPDHRSVLLRNDDAAEIGNVCQPAHRPQHDIRRSGVEISAGNFDVLTLDRIANLLCGQAVRREAVGVQQQLDLPAALPVKVDAADIVHGFQNLFDLFVDDFGEFLRIPF